MKKIELISSYAAKNDNLISVFIFENQIYIYNISSFGYDCIVSIKYYKAHLYERDDSYWHNTLGNNFMQFLDKRLRLLAFL